MVETIIENAEKVILLIETGILDKEQIKEICKLQLEIPEKNAHPTVGSKTKDTN